MTKWTWAPRALTCVALCVLSACSLTPDYQRPQAPVPEHWAQSDSVPADTAAAQAPWASYFNDERLKGLILKALAHNRDLRVAMLNVEQVQALYQVQRADQVPTLNASVVGLRQPALSAPHAVTTTATGGVTITAFELDFFGRLRSLSEAASAQLLATQEARKAAQISLVAAVANGYYTLWADRWQIALAERTLQTRQGALKVQQLKFDHGVLNELDLRSAQSLLEAARISRAQAQRQWAQDLNALQLLVGEPVAAEALPPAPVDVSVLSSRIWPDLTPVPVGLPSQVLLQRPDVAQAEQLLLAANANIGAARAALFPRITLTASAGAVSDSLSGLVNEGRSAWSLSPQLLLPIFDAGRNQALVNSAQVKRDIAVAQYEKALQSAFREVADALVARSSLTEQTQAQQAQTEAEAARLKLASLRYDHGVANPLEWLDAQRSWYASQQALIATQLARQQAHIALYKALGGGW